MSSSAVSTRNVMTQRVPKRGRRKHAGKRTQRLPIFLLWAPNAQPPPARNRPTDNQVYRFQQIVDFGTVLTSSNVTATLGGQNFQLSNLPQSATYTSLFDQYRFSAIELWLQPNQTNNGGHTGWLYSAVDYDNAAAPASLSALQQYSNVKEGPFIDGQYHKYVPHVALAAYSGAFTSYANVTAPWLDCNSPTIQHYGLVFGVSVTTDNAITFNLQARFHLEFRNVL